jgi:hypothetical protein
MLLVEDQRLDGMGSSLIWMRLVVKKRDGTVHRMGTFAGKVDGLICRNQPALVLLPLKRWTAS